jgi:hypothetical protein
MITVTTIVSPGKKSGLECGNPKCGSIDINSFCQSPNKITGGPGDGCYNVDGPTTTSPTNGTEAFANACPDAFSYSTDIANHVYFCQTGSEYSVVFSQGACEEVPHGHKGKIELFTISSFLQ